MNPLSRPSWLRSESSTQPVPSLVFRPSPGDKVKHRKHLAWRKLSNLDQIRWAHRVMANSCRAYPDDLFHGHLSLNFDHAYEAELRASADPHDKLRRLIGPKLLDFGMGYWWVFEEAPVEDPLEQARRLASGLPGDRRLHVHGELLGPLAVVSEIARVLCDAVGIWTLRTGGWNPRQIKIGDFRLEKRTTRKWVGYATKEDAEFTMSAAVRAITEYEYEIWRTPQNRMRAARGRKKK